MFSKILWSLLFLTVIVNGAPQTKQTVEKVKPASGDPVKDEEPGQPREEDELFQSVPQFNHARPVDPLQTAPKQETEKGSPAKKLYSKKNTVEPWRLCYFTNWAQWRPEPGQFWPEDIDVNLCTHLYYAFGWMEGNNLTTYEFNDIELYGRVNALKQLNPSLKTVLAVGGWTFGTSKMTLMISSKENRTEFINNAINYVRHFNFDGLDLDFEWPGNRGSPPEDKYLFTCLIKEIRAAFDKENPTEPLIFTAGVAAGYDRATEGYEMGELSKYLDKINLMTYDYFGGFSNTTNPHSLLYNRPGMPLHDSLYNTHYSVQQWIADGVPRHKINLGVAIYGRGNTLASPFFTHLGAPAIGPSHNLTYTLQDGIASYYEFCEIVLPKATREFSIDHQVPFCYFDDQWFGYEDLESIAIKMTYIKTQGLGGFMMWTIDYDDFDGVFCGQGTYPMLKRMNLDLFSYEVPIDEQEVPPADLYFCIGKEDGYHPDPESCGRFYQCVDGFTETLYCVPPLIYDPYFQGCRNPFEMDQEWVCANCAISGDCSQYPMFCDI